MHLKNQIGKPARPIRYGPCARGDAGQGDFHPAAVTDHAAVLDALELAAGTFPVFHRAENTLAEQATFFRLERAVVDRFRILTSPLDQALMDSGEATEMATYST